jgi:diguanylate cyclase (GGDEF)-like protein
VRRGRASARSRRHAALPLEIVLDLLEEHVYAGELLSDGRYVARWSPDTLRHVLGGRPAADVDPVGVYEARIVPEDRARYERFGRALLAGGEAEATYRVRGLDGVTRLVRDRARSYRAGGRVLVHGILSDVTAHAEADARAAEASERFSSLLDVVGAHVYLALGLPDGSLKEIFQGPGADRLLGGAEPDAEMENWEAALHPDDRAVYDAFNARLAAGLEAEAEYRLRGADGVTRWVSDRAATRRRQDGVVEISGIVSDVTERRALRTELDGAHSALSRVVEAMDGHLYTVRVLPGGWEIVFSGPNQDALLGGEQPDDVPWDAFVHPEDLEAWRAMIASFPLGQAIEFEYRLIGVDGRVRTVHDRLRPRREPDGTLFYDGVSRDVTERRRLEDELRRSARVDGLTGVFSRGHFVELAEARLAAGAQAAGLVLLDADHFKQVNDVHGHAVGDAVLIELARRLIGALREDDCLGRWGGEEFAVLLAGIGSDAELERRAEALRAAVADAPISVAGVTLRQTISLGAVRGGQQLATVDALVEAADRRLYAAKRGGRNRVALEADGHVGTSASEPEGVGLARALAFAASLRDKEPEAHGAEVSLLAALTAERLDLPEPSVWRCRLGGLLHDVGKVAVADAILEKPGALSPAEWDAMRTHPVAGADVVARFAALGEAAATVRHHHERYDGTGYPDGLAGAAIPIEARIVAAADAYSAMTADRPYSTARTPAQAADELRAGAGTHFDPDVVAALIDVLGPLARPDRRQGASSFPVR